MKIKRKRISNDYYDNRINDDNENDNLIVTSSTISVNIPLESIVHSTIYTTSELLPRNELLSQTEQTRGSTMAISIPSNRLGEDYPEQTKGFKNSTPTSTSTPTSSTMLPLPLAQSTFNIFAIVGTIVTIIIIIIIMITIIQKSIFIKENDDGHERNRFSFFWRFMKHNNNRDKLPIMASISNNTDSSSEQHLSVISSSKELRDSQVQQFDLIDNNKDSDNEIMSEIMRKGKFKEEIYKVIDEDKIEIESLASCGSDTIDLRPLESPNWDECME